MRPCEVFPIGGAGKGWPWFYFLHPLRACAIVRRLGCKVRQWVCSSSVLLCMSVFRPDIDKRFPAIWPLLGYSPHFPQVKDGWPFLFILRSVFPTYMNYSLCILSEVVMSEGLMRSGRVAHVASAMIIDSVGVQGFHRLQRGPRTRLHFYQ